MLVVPALDLRGGRVVRLGEHGSFDRETAYGDPVELARRYAEAGARRLHVVDLDAARGTGHNRPAVERVVGATGVAVEVAGGIRSEAEAAHWLDSGAAAVVLGTAAVREPELLATVAAAHPGRVLAALDVREGRPAVTGWSGVEERGLADLLGAWDGAPLDGVILTSVDRDGTLAGPDLALLMSVLAATRHRVTYSGGVRSAADVAAVGYAGAAAVILGRSLLEGSITLAEVLEPSQS
jgi:phosphoribosylformimino-5-aminoimidazole carboxamide ribotide isomerase